MLKKLLMAAFLALFTPLPVMLSARSGMLLNESFESGIPDSWSLEYESQNPDLKLSWIIEKSDVAVYPDGVADGNYRIAFRNVSGIEHKARTRLVSPVFDPSGLQTPVLCFSYAAPRLNGKFDTLCVKYRNVENGDEDWITLYRITKHSNYWKSDTIALVAWTDKYQLAFEGVDNLGRGICLDNIQVRELPQCSAPHSLSVSDISVSSAHLVWGAGFSQDAFRLKVSSYELKNFELTDPNSVADMADIIIDGASAEFILNDLRPGIRCYWYIQTICGDDHTDWVKGPELSIPNQIDVPFKQDFNVENINVRTHPENWSWANSMGGDAPFINTNQTDWLDDVSADGTYALVFGIDDGRGSDGEFEKIPAGEWAYLATPEIMVDDISLLQVKFDASKIAWNNTSSRILVGVMSDPSDIQTFLQVAEVNIPIKDPDFSVNFASYDGDGKHIAFLSRFDEPNLVAIDNIEVSFAPDCPKVKEMSALYPSAQSVVLDWKAISAEKGDIVISPKSLSENYLDTIRHGVIRMDNTAKPAVIENSDSRQLELSPAGKYYVYVRNRCDEGESGIWSDANSISMPDIISNVPKQNIKTISSGRFNVMPEIVGLDIKSLEVKFIAAGNVIVGVMDTLGSESSFTLVEQSSGDRSLRKVDFADYNGNGRFIAFFGDVEQVKLGYISRCTEPTELSSVPADTFATLKWTASSDAKYEVRVAKRDIFSTLDDDVMTDYVFVDTVSVSSVRVGGLEPVNTVYYWWVRTVCTDLDDNTKVTYSDWSLTSQFSTLCPDVNELPYILDFETMSGALTDYCINVRKSNNYPSIKNYVYGVSGYTSALAIRTYALNASCEDVYVVFNPMDIENVRDLTVSFKTYNATSPYSVSPDYPVEKQHIDIGVMNAPNDYESFTSVAKIAASEISLLEEHEIALSDYKGTGKYIAIRALKNEDVNMYVFDLHIERNPGCVKVFTPVVSEVSSTAAKLSWRKSVDSKWQLVIAENRLTELQLETVVAAKHEDFPVVVDGINVMLSDPEVTDNSEYSVSNLVPSTKYFVYVRALCDVSVYSSWCNPAMFVTVCPAFTIEELGTVDFEVARYSECETRPDCWTLVNTVSNSKWAPVITDENAHSGDYSLKVASETSSLDISASYAIMPSLDIDDISNYRMTFYGSCGFMDYEKLTYWKKCQVPEMPRAESIIIGVTSSVSDLSRIRTIDTIRAFEQWQPFTVSFEDYHGDDYAKGTNVVFISEFKDNNVFFIDDISFERVEKNACATPLDVAIDDSKDVADNALALKWRSGKAPYVAKVSDRQLSAEELKSANLKGVTTVENIGTSSYIIEGLKHQPYYVYIGSTCDDDVLWSEPLRYTPECRPSYSLPFSEKFDDYNAREGVMPDCWRGVYMNAGQEINRYPYVSDKGKNNKGLYIYTLDNNRMSYAVLPKLDADITDCQISFDAASENKVQRSVIVGVSTEISSDMDIYSTFIPVDTILLTSDEFRHFTVSLASTTPSAKYIVLSASYDDNWHNTYSRFGSSGGAYIDNLTVDAIGACQAPSSVKVSDLVASHAEITIDGDALEYALMKGDVGFVPDLSVAEKTGSSYKLTLGDSPVEIYVASYCGGVPGDAMYGPITVNPIKDCTNGADGVTDNFDTSEKWNFLSDGQMNVWKTGTSEQSISNRMFVTSDNGMSESYNSGIASKSWVYRTLDLKPGLYTFSFRTNISTFDSDNYLRIGLLPVTSGFESGSDMVRESDGSLSAIAFDADPELWIGLDAELRVSEVFVDVTKELVITNSLAGMYNLVLYWQNSNEGNGLKPSAAIDNLVIDYQACVAPYDLRADAVSNDTAVIAWSYVETEGLSSLGFDVFVTSDVDAGTPDAVQETAFKIMSAGIESSPTVISGLPGGTPLAVFVRVHCSADGYSPWSLPVLFETLCNPVDTLDLVYDFDDEQKLEAIDKPEYSWQSPSVFLPECFIAGHIRGESIEDYAPLIYIDGGRELARSGSNVVSLQARNGIQSNKSGGYMALPRINADYGGIQMVFWMRAVAPYGSDEFYRPANYLDPKENDASITVGVMSDPNDPSTFEKIKVCRYPFTNTDIASTTKPQDDPNGNEYWVKYTIPLKGYDDKHIAFLNEGYGAKYNCVYIDDISFEPYTACMQPQDVKIIKVTSDSVLFTFNHEVGDKWLVEISEIKNMANVFVSKVSDSDTISISGLSENTKYYLTVSQVCGENVYSDPSMVISFTTNYGLRYREQFSTKERTPENWLRTNGTVNIDNLLNGTQDMISNVNMTHPDGWQHKPVDEYMSAHQVVSISGDRMAQPKGYWMISPVIYVRKSEKANLTLDVAVTQTGISEALLEGDLKAENVFVVAISEDEGKTFVRENLFFWDNDREEPKQFRFDDLTNTFKQYTIDLSKFADKNIRIAFASYSFSDAVAYDLHIDNIVINTMDVIEINETLCAKDDFVEYGFEIPYEKFEDGNVYKEQRYCLSDSDAPDVLYKIQLQSLPPVQFVEQVSVCETALPYIDSNGFYLTESGLYSKRIVRDGACDSVYTIDFRIVQARKELVNETICRGGSFDFNGRIINESGVYFDTVPSLVTGCDSIVTLRLEVLPAAEYNDTVIVCFDESYEFNGKDLTVSGDYTETFMSGECDSTVHLHFIVRPEYIDIKNVAICQGDVYNDEVFKGLKSNFCDTLVRKSVDGCDSIVGLELVVISDEEFIEVEKNITREDLPYKYFGYTFDADTRDGTSVVDIPVKDSGDKCQGTVRLTLNVGEKTDVHIVGFRELTLSPNPVSGGEVITLNVELSDTERQSAIVEVINSIGSIVEVSRPNIFSPIALRCDYSSGVYIVRLKLENGVVYQGKIIVR